MEIKIPNLGDIDEVEVIELCVAVGDSVAAEDPILVIESDKASMEIPAPAAGVVEAIHVALGDMVGEDHLIATLSGAETDAGDTASPSAASAAEDTAADAPVAATAEAPAETPAAAAAPTAASQEAEIIVPDIGDATDVVVIEIAVKPGDIVAINDLLIVLESDKASMEIAAEVPGTILTVDVVQDQEVEQGTLIATIKVEGDAVAANESTAPVETTKPAATPEPAASIEAAPVADPAQPASEPAAASDAEADVKAAAKVYAGPAVRRLARELGVDLTAVEGTGNRGRIVKDDVKAHVKARLAGGGDIGASLAWPTVPSADYAKFGEIELTPLTRIQQRGADNLHKSWVNLPHVTQHDEADITDMEEFRASLKQEAERKGVKLTPLAFIIKACCHALGEYPMFNSSLHEDGKQLVVKKYVNVGMAVDTPEGLVVPVIKDADKKSMWTLSAEIAELSDKARNKKLGLNDLQGGTFSVSSLGALGGTGFTPIVNAPEVAILGVSRLQTKPQWDGEAFQPRKMLPLSLSYDHRVINGADGGRFMMFLVQALGDLRRLAL